MYSFFKMFKSHMGKLLSFSLIHDTGWYKKEIKRTAFIYIYAVQSKYTHSSLKTYRVNI